MQRPSAWLQCVLGVVLIGSALTAGGTLSAQQAPPASVAQPAQLSAGTTRPPVTAADYGKWETPGSAALSDDGRWLAMPIARVDGTSELRVHQLGDPAAAASPAAGQTGSTPAKPYLTASEGREPAFSTDGQWLAFRVGYAEADREKLQDDKKPIRDKVGLVRLDASAATAGEPLVVADVTRFAFAESGPYLALHRYVPEGSKRKGADLLVRNVSTGSVATFGNVAEFAWQDKGRLLAITIDAEGRSGNGVQLYDPQSGALHVLDSGEATFTGLSWREKDDDLAVFRSRTDDRYEEDTHLVRAWRDLSSATGSQTPLTFDQTTDTSFPAGMRIVPFRRLQWAKDGSMLCFGIREWDQKSAKEKEKAKETPPKPKAATVDVWHSRDQRIIPMQRVEKTRDLERNYPSAWRLDDRKWVRIGTNKDETVQILEGDQFATETDGKPYQAANMFDRTRNDIYLVSLSSGSRTRALEGVWYFQGASPGGHYLLYFTGDQYWTYDVRSGRRTNITTSLKTTWIDPDYDTPVRVQRPPAGVAGWLKDDAAVLLNDQFDIWRVAPDGSGGTRLTRGAEEAVQYRYARLDREERFIDPAQPIYLNIFGRWTKKDGYARMTLGSVSGTAQPAVERLLWVDKNIGNLMRAKRAPVFVYSVQDFDDSADYLVGGPALSGARQVTHTNPFQSDYAWGRSTLVDYKTSRNERLQGALYYPANYVAGRRYPMIVYVYERLSQGLHNYVVPSERSPYNTAVFTANGYFVLQPDIVFRPRDPGIAAVDCVSAAVKAVVDSGMIDPKRVGLVGHSWGGYEASFIPTQTNIFAASVAGAPLTNFLSFFGAIHWNQGMPETQHFETGQARMDVPYWDDMAAYVRNSSVMSITKLQTPMLVFFGDKDGTVDWHQGVEFYNYARRAGKFLVMLVYAGENHSAREKPNQIDYHRRILQWFDHYLKGVAAPPWIAEGVSVIDSEKAQTGR